jgi:hypothetical protein
MPGTALTSNPAAINERRETRAGAIMAVILIKARFARILCPKMSADARTSHSSAIFLSDSLPIPDPPTTRNVHSSRPLNQSIFRYI